tara:strand:- start:1586 stop:1996 length:411 start_codon:yes stop_codon:yes gene_type:complete
MTDTTKLAERIEALEGPCREMDREIFKAVGAPLPKAAFGMDIELQPDPNSASGFVMPVGELQVRYECPHYTTSLDAAMTLVPEGWGWFKLRTSTGQVWVEVEREDGTGMIAFSVHAATPALALCAAALRAQEAHNG